MMNTFTKNLITLSSIFLFTSTYASAQIIFPDTSEQMTAAPSHHGGENSSLNGIAAFIGGGLDNSIFDDYSVIGGGSQNDAGSDDLDDNNDSYSTVIGGSFNDASGFYTVIAGGYLNTIDADWAAISGGQSNTVQGDYASIAGGLSNSTNALYSAIPGGSNNSVTDLYGFVAGNNATDSNFWYSFVWGGETGARSSAGDDTFNVWSANGIYLNGSVRHSSDRNLKEDFREVNQREVLNTLLKLPVTEWRFKAEDESTTHIGPMAQDFKKAFNLGGQDDRHIAATDADGVVLVAIQGLSQVLNEKQTELDTLTKIVETYEKRLNEIEAGNRAVQGGVQ